MEEKLKQIKVLDELKNEKLLEIERLEVLATKVNASSEGERVQSSGGSDKVADNVIKIVDLKNEINDDIHALIDLKKECESWIKTIDDNIIKCILYKRYFSYKTWEQIADELHYSSRWIQKIHRKFMSSL